MPTFAGRAPGGYAASFDKSVRPAGSAICVGNEEEIGTTAYAQLWRNNVTWPDRDREVMSRAFAPTRSEVSGRAAGSSR